MFKVRTQEAHLNSKNHKNHKRAGAFRERISMSNSKPKNNSFSFNWIVGSVFIYLLLQVVFGMGAQQFVLPNIAAEHTKFLTEGLIVMLGFYVGAFVIGVISPGLRTLEPVLGAMTAILAAFSIVYFTPISSYFVQGGLTRIAVGCTIAAVCAAAGVHSGEKLMGNIK